MKPDQYDIKKCFNINNYKIVSEKMYGSNSYGSMGSSYGGMNSYGSSYGGGYGSSYGGGYGMGGIRNQQNMQNGQNPQNNPEQNERKKVFEEYFQMMGGMRSILELGFAGIALANFGSRSWSLIKKVCLFLFNTSLKFASAISQYIPIETIKEATLAAAKIGSSNKTSIKWRSAIIVLLRILAVALFTIGYKLRTQIKSQVLKNHEQLQKEVDEIEKKKQNLNKNFEKYQNQGNL